MEKYSSERAQQIISNFEKNLPAIWKKAYENEAALKKQWEEKQSARLDNTNSGIENKK